MAYLPYGCNFLETPYEHGMFAEIGYKNFHVYAIFIYCKKFSPLIYFNFYFSHFKIRC